MRGGLGGPVLLALALAAAAVSAGYAADKRDYDREIARQKRELDDLRDRLQSEQRELAHLRERKVSALGTLEKLAGNIRHTEEYLSQLDATEGILGKSLSAVKDELSVIEARIRERNQVMGKRVKALYMAGGPDRFVMRGWEPGHGDFLRKVFFMKRVLRYDRELVDAAREDAELKRRSAGKMDARLAELSRFRARKAQERETFSRARRDQEKRLAVLQTDEQAKQQALAELEENARLVNEIIASLEKRRKEEQARGKKAATQLETGTKYCLPVQGEVVSKFGLQYHATLKTTTKNLGIEIKGAPGAGVRAAVSGEVALISRIPGYGMGVILDNGSDVFTIYANLAGIRVRQGDKVRTCQELGAVSTEAGRVYFEVRKGTRTLDPAEWLKSGGK
jgi:septal ring factor EnvC (AmiA/AmiB activator)